MLMQKLLKQTWNKIVLFRFKSHLTKLEALHNADNDAFDLLETTTATAYVKWIALMLYIGLQEGI